jgi:hypothetical protein
VIWRMPWKSAQLRLSGTYRSRMLVDFGDTQWLDSYYDLYMTFNMGFSHKVSKHVTLKYEAKNLFNTQPTYSTGPNGRFRTEIDDYGRFLLPHHLQLRAQPWRRSIAGDSWPWPACPLPVPGWARHTRWPRRPMPPR